MTTKQSYAAKIAAGLSIRCQDKASRGRHCERHAARTETPLGALVLAWRAEHNVDQARAAKMFGISRPQLSLVETGKRTGKYSEKQIRRVCARAPTPFEGMAMPQPPPADVRGASTGAVVVVVDAQPDNDADASLLDAALSAMEG